MLLTSEQAEIIERMANPANKTLVLAAPGSGKTTTLEAGVQTLRYPFIALTFTNKAARELKRRLRNQNAVFIGTFHGLCIKVLNLAGISFRILTDDESDSLFKKACSLQGISKELIPFWKSKIEYARSFVTPETQMERNDWRVASRIIAEYHSLRQHHNAVDFNDLLYMGLLNIENVTRRGMLRPEAVLIDEWQDTNEIQYGILKFLTNNYQTGFTVVGDQDQTLYEFRGANYANTRKLIDEARPAIMHLSQTWRFGHEVGKYCNQLIRKNTDRLDHSISTHHDRSEVRHIVAYNPVTEANLISEACWRLDGTMGILCRTAMQMIPIETALIRKHIRYTKLGGLKLSERAKVRRFIDLLLWAEYSDESALLKFLKTLKLGLGKRFLAQYNLGFGTGRPKFEEPIQTVEDLLDAIKTDGNIDTVPSWLDFIDEHDRRPPAIKPIIELFVSDSEDIQDLLSRLILASAQDEEPGNVTIATVHAVKGLEFDSVWIPGMEEGIFPHAKSQSASDLESERRVVYVAMSRAKRRLTISRCAMRKDRKGTLAPPPSRFINDMGLLIRPESYPAQRGNVW